MCNCLFVNKDVILYSYDPTQYIFKFINNNHNLLLLVRFKHYSLDKDPHIKLWAFIYFITKLNTVFK